MQSERKKIFIHVIEAFTKRLFVLYLAAILYPMAISAKPKTNLEAINLLVDSLSQKLKTEFRHSLKIKSNLEGEKLELHNKILANITQKDSLHDETAIVINNCDVKYNFIEFSSLWNDASIERIIRLSGTFSKDEINCTKLQNFSYSFCDTVSYSEIEQLEKSLVRFDKGEKPELPLFGSISKPIIYILGSGIITYLFFSVRSK